jgi:hypothetical protein
MAARKAASVLPDPVGAKTSVEWPAWISGQPSSCARVGRPNVCWNHSSTAGWNRASMRAFSRSSSARAGRPRGAAAPSTSSACARSGRRSRR